MKSPLRLLVIVCLLAVGVPVVAPASAVAASSSEIPLVCAVAPRGFSTFARLNISEIEAFQASRSDFRHRLVQYDAGRSTPASVVQDYASPAQAYAECATGVDNSGAVVDSPAAIVFEISSFTRPAWRAQALAHPDIEWVNLRSPIISNPLPNMHWYVPQEYRAWYVKGIVAALVSKKGHIGMVLPLDRVDQFSSTSPAQFVQNTNAFLLGAKLVNPEATITTISTQTFNETVPSARWPGYENLAPTTIPDYLDCFTEASLFDAAINPDASAIPDPNFSSLITARNGVPLDCLAVDKLADKVSGVDKKIDVIANQKASYFTQRHTLEHLNGKYDPAVVENSISATMAEFDQSATLGNEDVLTATLFDFQPIFNQVADQYLSDTLPTANQEFTQSIDGEPVVGLSRLSTTRLSVQERESIEEMSSAIFAGSADPFCDETAGGPSGSEDLASDLLDGHGYTFVNGCLTTLDKINGTAFSNAPSAFNPNVTDSGPLGPGHIQCIPVANTTLGSLYPLRCL